MTKNELKAIIKECMLEILTEGLGNSLNEVSQKKRQTQQLMEKRNMAQREIEHRRSVSNKVKVATSDPVMQQIFEHTAQTTLPDQLANEIRTPSAYGVVPDARLPEMDMGASSGPGIDISSIFAGKQNNWEAAAFAPAIKRT